jgi:hypothetical protein
VLSDRGVCPVTIAERDLLGSACADRTVRLWAAAAPASLLIYDVSAICRIGDSLAIWLAVGILVIGVISPP